eukprot:gnl/Dysnectes_brevis/64_a81_15162.p1 GENE.gnl/Dysnectes_brevis/64_a81_15162~~gnl/Dysnectes_brevis/64_a81_15162.p1  ORF type:complete len:114 (+),score=9.85 gnl/Dysnectes_brevis/64_a81_15162:42-383(+)
MSDQICGGGARTGGGRRCGGWSECDVEELMTSEHFRPTIDFAVEFISMKSNAIRPLVFDRLISASSQVVAGIQYRLVMVLKTPAPGDNPSTHSIVIWRKPNGQLEPSAHRVVE